MSKWAEEAAKGTGAEVKRLIFKETAPKEANEAWKKFRETKAVNETEAYFKW